MSVHYKFKAALDYSTVTFDGIHISVGDLKKEIIEQKRLAKNADFDLQIQNAQTKEVYQDEITLIPKNTSVIVARVPTADKKKSGGGPGGGGGGPGGGRDGGRFAAMQRNHLASLPPAALSKGVDLAAMDMTEEEKIKAMMSQATADYDPSRYMKIRGSNQHGRVPDNYRCYKCNNAGHWIKNCPMVSHDSSDVKKSTGIPRSFMVMVEGPEVPGALITPEGQYAVPAIDREAYSTKNKPAAEPVQKPKIPEELICPICQDLLTDALLVPCCANSYCDECIRNTLLESDDLECPGCREKDTSPNELIPNRFLRTAVNAFKNETGYSKPSKLPDKKEKESHKEAQAAAAESRKVSLEEELPEDLFPHSPRKIDPEAEQVDSSKADDVNSSDLYDFNDGSIPSPFAIQDNANSNSSSVKEPPAREMDLRPPPGPPPHYHGPPPMHSHPRGDYNDYRGPPPNYNRGPPHHPYGPPPSQHHQGDRDRDRDRDNREPPPPGFGDVLPPGEERMQLPPQMRHPNSGPPPHHMMGPGPRDDRQGPPPGPGGPPPLMQGPPPPGAFMQPPPGYGPPGSMHRPPPMGGPPPPGPFPPNQYPPNFNRMPPPPGDPMYPPGPYPLMDSRHRDRERDRERDRVDRDRDRGRDRDRERDDFDRGRGPPRRPFHRDGSGPSRIGGRLPGDENRPGPIEDPLKEFERLMREKDRRKQQMTGALKKRSKSRSGSPLPRRSQSPHLRKRTRSPSFPRSPSPKRKRTLPILKRRNSYSRSRSRTPPQPVRRAPRSRSRSRERDSNRSGSPHFPKRAERAERDRDRRSPRRAPPFSPSPPPSSRYPKKEKDEYFRDEHQSRYDDRHSRYSSSSSSKHHTSRDYDGSSKYEGSSKYDGTSKYESSGKYDERYEEKYPPEKYDSGTSRHDPHHSSSSSRYDYSSKSSTRNYHSASHRGGQPASSGPLPASPGGQRDRDKPYFDSNQNSNSRRPYEFESALAPPGTDSAPVPSLLDINVDIPPGMRNMDYHNDSRGGPPDLMEKSDHKFPVEIKTKKEEEVPVQDKQTTEKDAPSSDSKKDTKEHRRRKSSEDKKLKKKKHKKEKKKDKEEKKDKKRKKSKDGEGPGDTLTGLLIDPATLETDGKADPLGSLVGVDSNNIAHEIKLTAPCDSTVKSPDRPGFHKDTVDVPARVGPRSIGSRLSQDDTYPPGVDEPIENAYISLRGVVMSDLTKQPPSVKDVEKNSQGASEDKSFVVPMPASKWDEFDENDDSNTTYASKIDTPHGDSNDKPSKDSQASRVPADVIRRAENVIFEKPITVQTISVMVTTEMNEQGKNSKSPTPMKKITLSDIGTLPPEDLKDTGKESDGESKHGKSVLASAVFRRPLKDRLGSKVSEDEAIRTPKEEDSRAGGSSGRSRRTPPRESRDRRRSKSKSPVRSDKSRRERSRSARRERSRSPARRAKSRTPPRRERDERRERSRSPQRRERSRSPKIERPIHRRDRSRSPVAQRRDRSKSPVVPRRDRSRSPVAQRRDRSRSPVAQRRDRSRSRERRERDRPAEPRPLDRPERRRTRSRSRDRRHNPRSPIQLPSRAGLKARSPEPRRNYERNPDSRHEQSESSRRRRSQNRELSPGASTRASPKRDRPSSSDSKSRSSDKARDGASGVAAAFTNEYADLKKTKQRINIKLSSTAKLERDSNSSSSDEQEGPEESVNENLTAAVLESLGTDPITGLLDPANAAKKKKKAKKHRSSSSSSSSSSSDGKHKKKSKKSKKKKKKKKKSK